jgi:hypothetical protein
VGHFAHVSLLASPLEGRADLRQARAEGGVVGLHARVLGF